jgi:hypothetical protein
MSVKQQARFLFVRAFALVMHALCPPADPGIDRIDRDPEPRGQRANVNPLVGGVNFLRLRLGLAQQFFGRFKLQFGDFVL